MPGCHPCIPQNHFLTRKGFLPQDADGTKAAVEAFSTMYKEAVQNAVKDALKGKPPKAGNGGDKPPMTKEQILEVKNPSERQKLIAENITLFQ